MNDLHIGLSLNFFLNSPNDYWFVYCKDKIVTNIINNDIESIIMANKQN
jgi:hypothetical protein